MVIEPTTFLTREIWRLVINALVEFTRRGRKYILYKSYDDTLYKMPAPRIHSQHMKRKQSTWKQKYNKFVESRWDGGKR